MGNDIVIGSDDTVGPDGSGRIGGAIAVAESHFENIIKTPLGFLEHALIELSPCARAALKTLGQAKKADRAVGCVVHALRKVGSVVPAAVCDDGASVGML